jgi:hypothetical protein
MPRKRSSPNSCLGFEIFPDGNFQVNIHWPDPETTAASLKIAKELSILIQALTTGKLNGFIQNAIVAHGDKMNVTGMSRDIIDTLDAMCLETPAQKALPLVPPLEAFQTPRAGRA